MLLIILILYANRFLFKMPYSDYNDGGITYFIN